MALEEILTADGEPMELSFARGNVGAISDSVENGFNEIEIPEVTGGGSGEHSYVF